MSLSHDMSADVLYITFEALPPDDYIYVENESGDVLRLDRLSHRIVGCTLPFFSKRASDGKINVAEIGGIPFNQIAEELLHA